MEAFTRLRCGTLILKFYDVKQTRSLTSAGNRNVKVKTPEFLSQIPDGERILERFHSMKSTELAYKESLFCELLSECTKENILNNEKIKIKKKSIFKLPITILQEYDCFSSASNITDKLLSYLEPFPFDKSRIFNKEKTGKINLYFIKNSIEKEYLAWKFHVNLAEMENIRSRLKFSFFKFRSLSNLKKTTSLLETIPQVQKQSVPEKIYHLNQNPFNVNNVINFQDKIAGMPWHVFPHHCPKILKHSHQYILFVVSILEDLEFNEQQIQIGLPFLHHDFITIIEKLNDLLKMPELKKYRDEPEFLQLLHFKSSDLMSLISSKKTNFKELIESVNFYTSNFQNRAISKKSAQYLTSLFYKIDSQVIKRSSFKKFRYVHETQIYETLAYLKEVGFTSKEIEESFPIIFYPSFHIARTLDEIKNEDESLKKIGYSDGCIVEDNVFTKGTKEKRKLLQLCLYYMEKPFHFSGDGIWFSKEFDDQITKT